MEPSIELRQSAARCLRLFTLSRSNLSLDEVAFLETLAAALIRDPEQSEAAEVARLAAEAPRAAAGVALVPSGLTFAASQPSVSINQYAELELDTLSDRRRPGRRDDVSPALIPLLREESIESLPTERADVSFDDLRGSRGIILWVLVSAAVWSPLLLWIGGLGR